jgi:hypothetical protein
LPGFHAVEPEAVVQLEKEEGIKERELQVSAVRVNETNECIGNQGRKYQVTLDGLKSCYIIVILFSQSLNPYS